MPFEPIYEDNHLWVVNKHAGLLVQADSTSDKSLLDLGKDFLKKKHQKPGNVFLGVVHRLDRPVSGVVVLAKTSKALSRMNQLFKVREVQKEYWAVVEDRPPSEDMVLVHWLKKDPRRNVTKVVSKNTPGGQRCELHFQLEARIAGQYLLKVTPTTGRPHQIRVQLSKIGLPIRGDVKYGYKGRLGDGRGIALHARRIGFVHPVRKESVSFEARLPKNQLWDQFLELDVDRINDR